MCIILRAKCAYHERYTHSDLIEKKKCQCHKKSNRNLWNYGTSWNIQKEQIKKFPLAKNQPLSANWCEGTSTIML